MSLASDQITSSYDPADLRRDLSEQLTAALSTLPDAVAANLMTRFIKEIIDATGSNRPDTPQLPETLAQFCEEGELLARQQGLIYGQGASVSDRPWVTKAASERIYAAAVAGHDAEKIFEGAEQLLKDDDLTGSAWSNVAASTSLFMGLAKILTSHYGSGDDTTNAGRTQNTREWFIRTKVSDIEQNSKRLLWAYNNMSNMRPKTAVRSNARKLAYTHYLQAQVGLASTLNAIVHDHSGYAQKDPVPEYVAIVEDTTLEDTSRSN